MEKVQIDELYHLLRVVSNEKDKDLQGAIYGLVGHLLAGGDYLRLLQYCTYYGVNYLLDGVCEIIKNSGWNFERVVEFGAGHGWLAKGISQGVSSSDLLPPLLVDKRHWVLIDVVADLETDEGRDLVYSKMKDNDLIVMADFLHCTEDPKVILEKFPKWNKIILEYQPNDEKKKRSYNTQLKRFGGDPIESFHIPRGREIHIEPYSIVLVDKED